jgi:hypothetical protein
MRHEDENDDLLTALQHLPKEDVDDWRREHIRLAAQRTLRHSGGAGSWLARVYLRVVEPISVAMISGSYLVWALQRVLQLHGF